MLAGSSDTNSFSISLVFCNASSWPLVLIPCISRKCLQTSCSSEFMLDRPHLDTFPKGKTSEGARKLHRWTNGSPERALMKQEAFEATTGATDITTSKFQ